MRLISGRHGVEVATVLLAALVLIPAAAPATSTKEGGSISLVAYSTPKEAYGQIISAFQKTKAGQGVSFQQSYAGSTEQAQAVVNGLHADGAMIRKGKTHAQAVAYLRQLFQHTVSQDKSAREALQTFLAGRGDVLLSYENEAILAQRKSQPVYYLIPKATIRIENPVAVTTNASDPTVAKAFVAFLHTPAAQKIYGQNGYRPVDRKVVRQFNYPVRPWLFTIQRFGGWAKVQKQFFDPKTGIVTKIEQSLGR